MNNPIKVAWAVCRLRQGPQDMPYSQRLLYLFLGINFLLGTLVNSFVDAMLRQRGILGEDVPKINIEDSMIVIAVALMVTVLFIYIGLNYTNKKDRIVQTLTTIFGVNMIMQIIFMLLILFFKDIAIIIAFASFMIWTLVVNVHILANSFDVKTGVALLLAFIYMFIRHNAAVFVISAMAL